MKKLFYLIGVFVTTAAFFAALAVLLNKLKISLSIEGIDDGLEEEPTQEDIGLSIEKEPEEVSSLSLEEELEKIDDSDITDEDLGL